MIVFGLDKKLKAAVLEDEQVSDGIKFARRSLESVSQSLESIAHSLKRIADAGDDMVAEQDEQTIS